jgi:hypothetical protein
MTSAEQLKQDLDYVASAIRRHERPLGPPAVWFLWALLVPVGFALPDFAPRSAGAYWFFAGIGGGLVSWWLGQREARRRGVQDAELSRRIGLHWIIAGVGFVLCGLPLMTGQVAPETAVPNYMLVAGLVYALAGVHLLRPMLWIGALMLAAYAALVVAKPPYAWTLTGLVIAVGLAWAGISARAQGRTGAAQ